jgi:hypothetical protein
MPRKIVTFTGNNGAGAIAVPGVKAGDQILSAMFNTGTNPLSGFASFVLTNGEILQWATGDLSTATIAVLLERKVMLP